MWGRLKRRILRSKGGVGGGVGGGGVYNSSSHDGDDFSNTRDTYRDFREELYDDSPRGSGSSWKEAGGKPGKKMSLTKTPFPNLDRCSCGTPGGRDLQENVAKSETLRRKNDFILGVDGKSWKQAKGGHVSSAKARNDYTSTSTGPGTRGRALQDGGGGVLRLRASTSTGQIPCSGQESEERTRNVWNRHRRHDGPGRRLAYSDDEEIDDDDDDESEEEEEVVEDEEEEEDSAEGEEEAEEEARVPSTSQLPSFRNSSQSEGTKSSSNSSDYTSLAFDLNYVKVSPPKLRLRRRKKNNISTVGDDDKSSSAPLMVRRERRPFPEVIIGGSTPSDRLPPLSSRATESKRPVAESGSRDETTTSVAGVVRLDQGHPPCGTSKEGDPHSSPTQSKGDASCRQPIQVRFSPRKATRQEEQLSSGYVSWADIHNPSMSAVSSTDGGRNISEVSGSERVVEERGKEGTAADVPARGSCGEISTSGSVLQFTFTVRIDNDVFRGTRRDVERTNEAAASGSGSGSGSGSAGSSLVSGRVDILNQEQKPGVTPSAVGGNNVTNQDQQQQRHLHQQQATYNTGGEALSLVQRSFKVQLEKEGARADGQNVASSKQTGKLMLAEPSNVSTDQSSDGLNDPTTLCATQQQVHPTVVGGGNGLDRITKHGSVVVPGVGGRQRTLEDFFVSSAGGQGTRMTTVAVVHKSASDHGDEMNIASLSRNELGPTDGRDAYVKSGDLVADAKAGPPPPRKGFDEVDSCSKSHPSQPPSSPPPPGSAAAVVEDGLELTHMSWDEVMREAESLGIPLSRPSQQPGGCSDRARHPSTSTDHQVLTNSSSPPARQGTSFQDVYWVCSSCTEAMQNQSSRKTQQSSSSSKTTSSPFKEKFKLQSIFGVSGGGKKPKGGGGEERATCKGQSASSPISRKSQSPGTKYKTIPIPAGTVAATAKDVVLWGGHNCRCSTTRRSAQTSRQRSLSPVSSTRCSQAVQSSSPRAGGHWGRGGDRRGQRVSHLCSPPLLRCRFSSTGRTLAGGPAPTMTLMKSAHLSSEMLSSSSSPVKRRANDNDRDFLKSLAQLMGCSWYWGTLSFEAAEAELVDRVDGAFLVRDSSDDRYILSVSFRSQRSTHHVRIERHNGMFSFSAEHGLHESPDIVNFIENAMEWSQSGQCLYYLRPRQLNAAPVPVQLIYPVSRFAH